MLSCVYAVGLPVEPTTEQVQSLPQSGQLLSKLVVRFGSSFGTGPLRSVDSDRVCCSVVLRGSTLTSVLWVVCEALTNNSIISKS